MTQERIQGRLPAGFALPSRPARAGRRRRRVLASVLGAMLAAAAVVTAGGLAASAYADVLPAVRPGASHAGGTPSAAPSHTPGGLSSGKPASHPSHPSHPQPPGSQARQPPLIRPRGW